VNQRDGEKMINKSERVIKRIIKAVGQKQSVLLIGDWSLDLVNGIKNNQNSITISSSTEDLNDNTFTRIIINYSFIAPNTASFYKEARRLLLPTGMIIISANCELNFFERLFKNKPSDILAIKPKVLQDQIHDNGFLIDGYYGYPGRHLLMMAIIQNKEVSTLFTSEKQETIHI